MPCIGRYLMATALHPNRLAGGCQCGAVRYEIRGEPLSLYVCHCRECQKQSASAFGISVIIKRADFRHHPGRGEGLVARDGQRRHSMLRVLPRLRLAPVARRDRRN